ncbi:polyphosphate--glucose phosphotransferase [Lacisediminihabitans profunda]|uniref:ROK family protein n=1 Tax=Lacisediminihabitans profunda TaxID=2594790 RepID=A0A5C8UVX2_9MICO|nr:ROK family protein [Lacisediminihabitans profunda]TXN32172.1 ROK family protein [Lacisediminihabitans profunda]
MANKAVGIDIGGTGIKGAIVDVTTGKLLTDRIKLPTPQGGEPEDILATVLEIVKRLDVGNKKDPIGVCFPAVVVKGRTLSAANVSNSWIGLEAEKLFEKGLGRNIHFVNDADAAGYAETLYGAAAKSDGLIIMTTLGTGIGTALIYKGVLIPNAELGHIQLDGVDYETRASYSAKERENLSWVDWAARLQQYYSALEAYFHPDLFILGGGVSKEYKNFLSLLHLNTPIVPATLRNNAGILGAAALAAGK